MSISEARIRSLMGKDKVILQAEAYLDDGRIQMEKSSSFWRGEASVKGNVGGYRCSASINGDNIGNPSCQCGQSGATKGLCSHLGALLLAYNRESLIGSTRVVYTSPEAGRILNKSRRRAEQYYHRENDIVNVGLSYELTAGRDILTAEYFITNGKDKYPITNLLEFEENFTYGVSAAYGNISIMHETDSFGEEFRPMVEFMLKSIKRRKYIDEVVERTGSRRGNAEAGQMVLVGDAVDEFMSFCYSSGGQLVYKGEDGYSRRRKEVTLTDNNPDIAVRLETMGTAGYKAELSGVEQFIKGHKRMYVLQNSFIYMADEAYTKAMLEFVEETVKAGYNGGTKSYNLVIGRKDMPAFYNLVLANIKKYCKVTAGNMTMEQFEPWELECGINIDLDKINDRIVCAAEFMYRGHAIDVYGRVSDISGICRDYRKEAQIMTVINRYFKRSEIIGGKRIYYADQHQQIFELIKNGIGELRLLGQVNVSEEVLGYEIVDSMKINANVSIEGGWLKLDIDAGEYTTEELQELLDAFKRKEKYIRLSEKRFVKLDDNGLELLAQMAYDLDFSATDIINHQVFIPRYRALYIDGRLREGELAAYDKDSAFRALVRTIKQVEDSEFLVPEELEDVLRGYQKHGFHWLRTLDACGFGGILADDMGLGKTLQVITLLLDEKISVSRSVPSLIVAPASLVYNWENEIRRFAPQLNCVAIVGKKTKRMELLEKYSEYDVLITSYELLKRDMAVYNGISFRFQVIDEAQNIKNYSTENARSVKKIKAQTRFALTGTPIENKLSELWSIFDFLMPGFLYNYKKFRDKFERPIAVGNETGAMKGLTRMISPFVLRRLKKDVLKELPDKLEYDIYTKLEGRQHKLYTANALKLKNIIEGTDEEQFSSKRMQILAELMNLRQLCCDPSLCYHDYDGESSKLEMCLDMVKNGIAGGHRILLFSQFTSMLDIIAERFDKEGISYYTLNGSTTKEKRAQLVDSFNNDETNVFLISLKAGGVGLNLTGADMVIHYDPWWNIAAENQASDRAHRIGQSKTVSVFKLISKGTVEENIRELQKSKAQLADNILAGETISLGSLSKNELLSILSS